MKEETLSLNIQRLADGSLDENDRRDTLNWIEQSAPCYWRDLALAFVEGQVLREASSSEAELTALPPLRHNTETALRWKKWATAGIAAILAIGMFVAGFSANSLNSVAGSTQQKRPFETSSARVATPPPTPSSTVPAAYSTTGVARSAAAVRKLNAAIAQSGYEASLITRYVSQKLDDGGRMVIPVNKVIVRQRAE